MKEKIVFELMEECDHIRDVFLKDLKAMLNAELCAIQTDMDSALDNGLYSELYQIINEQ